MNVLERAERKTRLLRQAILLVERLQANAAEHLELLEQRDSVCRELKEAGASGKELEEAMSMSRSRVQQILRGTAD